MSTRLRIVAGLITILFFSLVLVYVIPNYVELAGYLPPFAPGSETWPKVISIIGLAMGCLLAASIFKTPFSQLCNGADFTQFIRTNKLPMQRCAAIIIILSAYILLIPVLGLLVMSTLMLATLLISTSDKAALKFNLFISIALPIALNYLFASVTNTEFPVGWIWSFLG